MEGQNLKQQYQLKLQETTYIYFKIKGKGDSKKERIFCDDRHSRILMFLNAESDVNCWKSQNTPAEYTQPTGRALSASVSLELRANLTLDKSGGQKS